MESSNAAPWDREEFLSQLRDVGMTRYHHLHPFHRIMNEGGLSPDQLRGWVANRFYYQRNIPVKDAAILSNCPDREIRRIWRSRILDQDGTEGDDGGIEAWLRLAQAAGLSREETLDDRHVLPGVRFAVDAYVAFARTKPWPIAVASSLTELFAPDLMKERLAAFEKFYTFIPVEGLDYFRRRLTQARKDSTHAVELTIAHCSTRELQEEAVRALSFKCDVLWTILDAIMLAYGAGASRSESKAPASAPVAERGSGREDEAGSTSPSASISGDARPRLAKKARFKMDPSRGRASLLYPEGVLFLNPTGEAIVRLLDGQTSVQEIASTLADRYHTAPRLVLGDILDYLGRLSERRLLEWGAEREASSR
jgi:pyrroloquinoline-quinone synthase